MRIVTWNINSIRLRAELIDQLNVEEKPDIICLQETKTPDEYFPAELMRSIGFPYLAYIGEKSYNGVAILSKYPMTEIFALDLYDQRRRHICAKINGLEIHNFYVPAGGDEPDIQLNPKFKYKLDYIELMYQWFRQNRPKHDNIILVGDLNTAPHEHDVWSSRQLRNVISHTPVERELLLKLQYECNFIDTGRYFVDFSEKLYSWWSYRNKDWKKSNRGRRLDHIWVSEALKPSLSSIKMLKTARDWSRPSDHIPCFLDLKL